MKELCKIGFMEYHRRTIKSVTYHLTPEGEKQLGHLQRELINEMVKMFVAAKAQVRDRILSQSPSELQRVVLFGCGHLAQLAFHALELTGVRILGICDDNIETIGSDFCGREVLNSSQIRFLAPDAVIIADAQRTEEICQSLQPLLSQGITLIRLDDSRVARPDANKENAMNVIASPIIQAEDVLF